MFKIKDATRLTQWEQGILLLNDDMQSGDAVRFVNEQGLSATMTAFPHDEDIVVEIPNRLLQFDAVLTACIAYTDERTAFEVVSAEKPPNYEFINNESSNAGHDAKGDMLKSVYDADGDGVVDKAKKAETASFVTNWDEIKDYVESKLVELAILADYVVEEGKSGNWTYRKYANGTFDAWLRQAGPTLSSWTASGNMYYGDVITINLPFTIVSDSGVAAISLNHQCMASNVVVGASSLNFRPMRGQSSTITALVIYMVLHGKWK